MNDAYPVTVVTFPQALLLDIAGPVQVYTTANTLAGKPLYRVQLAAMPDVPNPVTDSGLCLSPTLDFTGTLPRGDLLVPGGPGVDVLIGDRAFTATLARQAARQTRLVSICSGSLLSAAAGLLDGKEATSHWVRGPDLHTRFPAVRWRPDAIFTIDGATCCSAGVTAGIDLILALVERDHGSALALDIAREMVVYLRRSGGQTQYSRPLQAQQRTGARITPLCAAIADDPGADWTVGRMAAFANMTDRTLHRHFLRDLGQSPSAYVITLRLDLARSLLDQGARNVAQVARAAGFRNEQAMHRAFSQALGTPPGAYRDRFGGRGAKAG